MKFYLYLLLLCSQTIAIAKGGGEEPVNPPAKTKAVSRYRAFMPAQQVVSQQFFVYSGVSPEYLIRMFVLGETPENTEKLQTTLVLYQFQSK